MKFLKTPEDFEDDGCFWFVSREYLLKATRLERFQVLSERESFEGRPILQKETLLYNKICRQQRVGSCREAPRACSHALRGEP